jgi:hypothetical protein
MSWLAAKAEELLNTADKRANEQIERVKEVTGILRTPAPVDEDEHAPAGQAVTLSAATAALLDPEERERLLLSGTACVENEDLPAELQTPAPRTPAPTTSDTTGGKLDVRAMDHAAPPDSLGQPPPSTQQRQQQQQQQRKARVAEWSALQQELQIVNMHTRKLHTRMTSCAAQLVQARAAEALAKRQLQVRRAPPPHPLAVCRV